MKVKLPGTEVVLPVKEQDVVNAIDDYLTLMRIPFARVRNTGTLIMRPGKDGKMQRFFGKNRRTQIGVADFLGVYKGRGWAMEVKQPGEAARREQLLWLRDWERGGGASAVVHSVGEVENFFKKHFI